jgi:hypothetical protein
MECFLYKSLNAAIKFGDESRIDSLGPYAQVMNMILYGAIAQREDIDEDKFLDL